MGKHSIITTALAVEYRKPRCHWHLSKSNFIPTAQALTEFFMSGEINALYNIRILKQNDRKIISLVSNTIETEKHVAKTFYLKSLQKKLKYYKYGIDETANIIIASGKGIPVPRLDGYGHIYNRFRVITASVLLLEYLEGLKTVSDLLDQCRDDETACCRILMRTIPIFTALYRAGCNHIDVNSSAIMLSENDTDSGRICILDFQHAKFYKRPSAEVLMAEAGRFSQALRSFISDKIVSAWFQKLLSEAGFTSGLERSSLTSRFQYYRDSVLSRKERKKVT